MRLFSRFFTMFFLFSFVCFITFSSSLAFAEDTAEEEEVILPIMDKPVLSPDGNTIAYFYGVDGELSLMSVDMTTHERNMLAEPGGLNFRWLVWANNERLLVGLTLRAAEGCVYQHENTQDARFYVKICGKPGDTNATLEGGRATYFSRDPSRLLAFDKNLQAYNNLFVPSGANIPLGMTLKDASQLVRWQSDVIDLLPDDPDHILINIDSDRDGKSEIRLVDVLDGSFDNIYRGRNGVRRWITDQNHQYRFGFGYEFLRSGSNYTSWYLNPQTNQWQDMEGQSWVNEKSILLAFAEDPSQAYIYTKERTIILQDLVNDITIAEIAPSRAWLLFEPDKLEHYGKPIGYALGGEVHYFNPQYNNLKSAIDTALGGGTNRIVSNDASMQKFIILHSADDAERYSGHSYLLLDLGQGSFTFLSDRYAEN